MPKTKYITDYLEQHAQQTPEKAAFIFEGRQLSWLDLYQEVETVSNGLMQLLPSRKQHLVGVLMPNSIDYVVAYLAILKAGHIAVPIDVIYKELEINAIAHQIKPDVTICDADNIKRLADDYKKVLISDIKAIEPKRQGSPVRLGVENQIATIFFTSGTTGRPKAAPYSHANHIWNIEVCSRVWGWNSSDTMLISLRLSHWYGAVMGLSGALYHGNTVCLQDRFSPEDTLKALSDQKITLFTHSPVAYARMLEVDDPAQYDLSGAKLLISGSGPLSPSIWQSFKSTFGAEILEVYGSSETGRIASNLPGRKYPGSPGKLLPGVRAKIVDGELAVKSPGLFPGYYHNSQLTKVNLTADGYWRTGDIAEISDNVVTLKGRKVEIIRKYGYTISPRDVEWALLTNSLVREVAVLGVSRADIPSDQLVYFVSGDITEDEIEKFSKTAMPSIWRPDKIVLLDSLPRTMSGKVNIPRLRAML